MKDTKSDNCSHVKYKKKGTDRNGNQRYQCLICKKTWTDKRRDNGLYNSLFLTTKHMFLDWINGHSYRTVADNHENSVYQINNLFYYMIESLPDYREMARGDDNYAFIECLNIDGGYISTNKGKKCFLMAVDADTNTVVDFEECSGETYENISSFLKRICIYATNLKYVVADLDRAYPRAINELGLTYVPCRVHMFMSLRKYANITLSHRKYNKGKELMEFEGAVRTWLFNSRTEEEYTKYRHIVLSFKYKLDDVEALVNHVDKRFKGHIIKQIPYRYITNNFVESWWNLVKTKMKTARSLNEEKITKWFNAFVLKFHFDQVKNSIKKTGMLFVSGKRFDFFNLYSFESVINQSESRFREITQGHNFRRS
jgi:hypothetical protein